MIYWPILSLKNGYGCFHNFCILHILNWSSASCLFDCTKNAPFFLDSRSTKYQVFFFIPIAPFCHSISICTVYSMHPLAWSKHYIARPADCGLNAVALHENQRRPFSCLVWIFWFGYIISSRLAPYDHFSLICVHSELSVPSLWWIESLGCKLHTFWKRYVVNCTLYITMYMYCRICSFAGYSSHNPKVYFMKTLTPLWNNLHWGLGHLQHWLVAVCTVQLFQS